MNTNFVKYFIYFHLFSVFWTTQSFAGGKDDPLLIKTLIDQFEVREADDGTPVVLEANAWLGKDLHKLWLKTEVERVKGETEEAELQLLYSRAAAPYWDWQLGLRRDIHPTPKRTWAVLGLQGLAPYFFEIDTALFIGESGRTALRVEAEYELMLTQRWVLSPEFEVNFYGQNDPDTLTGSGFSDMDLGLRLRYEIRRELAPYIGINTMRRFGSSAEMSRNQGNEVSETQLVLGLRAWF